MFFMVLTVQPNLTCLSKLITSLLIPCTLVSSCITPAFSQNFLFKYSISEKQNWLEGIGFLVRVRILEARQNHARKTPFSWHNRSRRGIVTKSSVLRECQVRVRVHSSKSGQLPEMNTMPTRIWRIKPDRTKVVEQKVSETDNGEMKPEVLSSKLRIEIINGFCKIWFSQLPILVLAIYSSRLLYMKTVCHQTRSVS